MPPVGLNNGSGTSRIQYSLISLIDPPSQFPLYNIIVVDNFTCYNICHAIDAAALTLKPGGVIKMNMFLKILGVVGLVIVVSNIVLVARFYVGKKNITVNNQKMTQYKIDPAPVEHLTVLPIVDN